MYSRREFIGTGLAALGTASMFDPRVLVAGRAAKKILILGGTGFVGPHDVREALKRGHQVTIFNRGKSAPGMFGKDVEELAGDRANDLSALKGRKWDAVIDESASLASAPDWVKLSVDLLKDNVDQYLFISTRSVYQDLSRVPMSIEAPVLTLENSPIEAGKPLSYGHAKAYAEKAAHAAMPGRVTVVRPGLIVGPEDDTDRFTNWPVRIARGGKSIYGAPLGILMLEARFPRIPGDMGNGETWPFPVLFRVVRGATPEKVVLLGAKGLLPDFIAAAQELVHLGAEAITTNCGFLSLFQRELAEAVQVPVATSSLMQVPWVQATLPPGKRVGVITVSKQSLTPAHLDAAGVPRDIPCVGTESGREFFRVLIRADHQDMDIDLATQDILDAGRALVAQHPDVGAIVLECTNMPPYAAALRDALGLPVYDIYSMITWFHAGIRPRRFG